MDAKIDYLLPQDAHTIKFHQFRPASNLLKSQANITTLRLINPKNEDLQEILSKWYTKQKFESNEKVITIKPDTIKVIHHIPNYRYTVFIIRYEVIFFGEEGLICWVFSNLHIFIVDRYCVDARCGHFIYTSSEGYAEEFHHRKDTM